MNGAVTLAPAAGETIDSVGALLPALLPALEPEEPEPEDPLEAVGELVPHAATASSAAAPVANTNERVDRICVLLQGIYWALVVYTSGRPVWFSEPGAPARGPGFSRSATRRTSGNELAHRPAGTAAGGPPGDDDRRSPPCPAGASGKAEWAKQGGKRGD